MKAVIALSGLAGLVLFGPPVIRSVSHSHHHVTVDVHEIAHQAISHTDQSQCRYEGERSFEVNVASGTDLRVLAGSGSLEVVGVEGLGEVRGVARACASHEEFLRELQLEAQDRGSSLTVEALYPDLSGRWNGGQRYARLDLRIEVPWGMAADVQDGSGEASFSNLGSLNLQDGSGEVMVTNIMGDIWVEDGSGEVEVGEVQGSVNIQDGSGELTVWSVSGDVEIQDGSGEITVEGVGGSITLSDGSGEIQIQDVQQDVLVRGDGSGSINVENVGGDFTVRGDGGGSIHHSNVAGRVDIPRKRGEGR